CLLGHRCRGRLAGTRRGYVAKFLSVQDRRQGIGGALLSYSASPPLNRVHPESEDRVAFGEQTGARSDSRCVTTHNDTPDFLPSFAIRNSARFAASKPRSSSREAYRWASSRTIVSPPRAQMRRSSLISVGLLLLRRQFHPIPIAHGHVPPCSAARRGPRADQHRQNASRHRADARPPHWHDRVPAAAACPRELRSDRQIAG